MSRTEEAGSHEEMKSVRKDPMTERTLRQFLKLESGLGNSPAFIKNYDTAVKDAQHETLVKPAPCDKCDYVANTVAEIHWHEERNPGHECCPDNEAREVVPLCSGCGNKMEHGYMATANTFYWQCHTHNCAYYGKQRA